MQPLWTAFSATALSVLPALGSQAGEVADAARSGDVAALSGLLESGAPADEPGVANPLHFALMSGHQDAARILLENGADPNADTALGTPLMVAAGRDRTELIQLLLDHGADLETTGGREQRTPLHTAAASGAEGAVRMLLASGANPTARSKFGDPPLHLALQKNHTAVAGLLREATIWEPPQPPTEADLLAAGEEKGRAAVKTCEICHPLKAGEAATGPTLWNIVGRPVGGSGNYRYSKALREDGGVWDVAKLDAFLADPKMALPGNMMATGNDRVDIPDQETRWSLIAYLTKLR
ncbi:ankyrin repeat domain-containing protein [Leisingera sp. McT4-56]|uniref:ankyrin repeat domain-containing protein n=1 Tax=Leisingera sp. McT4-56 TaxID=2881255 RepID=UPI001CF834C1|nr:ankyrin repeat domain-containing protein [Leisingera sp. McT4-56]MCB4458461.1 ankyrin repeat domain-containing protein [Leisingera sp. McT4-56]